ncbi:TraB/GumN family protein [Phenylobacterium sp.]|uniref:TraB/GumN family protein n=1 Tax=Phenylobacterium sp. TaxID=1871053 RepID=UPI0011FAAFF4|nr:TraB/GumN family protein [Phenylobacterium sp.]THD58310.1 MAG: TraB/GumN family protein [Phenylobacterium sp.]
MSRLGRTLAGLLTLCAVLASAPAALAFPPVWVVKGKDAEVVLFGSIHVLPPGLAWEPPALDRALKAADEVWFELPIDAQSEADTANLATQMGVLPPEGSLFHLLSPDDAALMSRVAATYDVSPMLLDRLKPWLAEISLAGGAYRKIGADANSGVEKTIAALATPKAQREAFETPQEQIAMLAGGTMDEQIASLRETLQELDEKPDEYRILIDAWMTGDVKALDHEALEPLRASSPALFQRLVTERNAHWTAVLDERLKHHGEAVVVVGVGHLIGPDGVPARLRALGYSVTGP